MSVITGNNSITQGLVLSLDAANPRSYTSGSTIWYDISGNGNHGTLIGGTTSSVDGAGSVLFSEVTGGLAGLILMPPSFSFVISFKPTILRNYNPAFGIAGWGVFTLHTTNVGSIYCGTDINTRFTPSTPNCGTNTILVNTSYHFCYSYDGTTGKLYKNATLLASATQTPISQSNAILPYFAPGPGNPSGMYLYNLQLYNRALSATEIQQNFNATRFRYGI